MPPPPWCFTTPSWTGRDSHPSTILGGGGGGFRTVWPANGHTQIKNIKIIQYIKLIKNIRVIHGQNTSKHKCVHVCRAGNRILTEAAKQEILFLCVCGHIDLQVCGCRCGRTGHDWFWLGPTLSLPRRSVFFFFFFFCGRKLSSEKLILPKGIEVHTAI